VKAAFPGFIEPALASPIERVPNGTRWLHEIKFDGYRSGERAAIELRNQIQLH
jgi:ATP-dependent DNA ligase